MTIKHMDHIHTDLFVKETDSHTYLDFGSCHPKSTKESIPYSQFLRIRCNCTLWTDYLKHAIEQWHYFQKRNYPMSLLIDSVKKLGNEDQNSILTRSKVAQSGVKTFYCITDFNPTNPNIWNLINNMWKLL